MIRLLFLLSVLPGAAWAEPLFGADSKNLPNSKMDIVLTEVERLPRVSVLAIKIRVTGSSVGASFFIACSLRRLAELRGPTAYIVKLEEKERMRIGFLKAKDEPPSQIGPEFRNAAVIDLDALTPICTAMEKG
jgi:hypothetical protein